MQENCSERDTGAVTYRLKHLKKPVHAVLYHELLKAMDTSGVVPEGKGEMLNQLEIFKNREFGEIRTVTMDGAPWFVGKDVADILGYQNGSRDINRHVDEEDRHKIMLFDGNQDKETIIISESGLYSLILSSKLATAKRFKHWVTSEVLPQIRRTGSYQKRLTPEEMMWIQLGMVDDHENRIEHLEKTMTIDYGQQQELKKVVNKRVIEILGGKKAPAYKELSKKVFAECNHDIQDYFAVNSRNNIPSLRFENALEYVEGWNPSNNTILDVRSCNAGMGGAHGV